MRISCCIDMMFSHMDFYDRFEAVRNCGIKTIEFWKWSNKNLDRIEKLLDKNNMKVSIFNLDSCNIQLSNDLSRGILNEGRADELIAAIKESIPVYRRIGASAMIVLIGDGAPFNRDNVLHCLQAAAVVAEAENINLVVEPLNSTDRTGYCMPYAKPVFELLREVNSPNIKMLYDIYHQSMTGDFSMEDIKKNIDIIGHFHVADAPGRHEPGTGNIDYVKIIREIEKPIAVSLEEAKKIKASVDKYKIEAVVNWPVAWRDYLYKMKNALDSGVVGKPIKLRYINGHTGPLGKGAKHRGVSANAEEMTDDERGKTWWHKAELGGGVYLDICCYGGYFTKWLMGDGEQSAMSYGANLNTPFGNTDDNFAAIVKYDDKMSVLEGTWTTPRAVIPSGPMVICTEGVVMCTGGAENEPDVKVYDIYGNEIELNNAELGEEFKNMPCHYVHHIRTGEPIFDMLTLDKNIEIMAIIDAAVKSSKSGKEEKICD